MQKAFACRSCEVVGFVPMEEETSEAILLKRANEKHCQDNSDCTSDIFLPPSWLVRGILNFAEAAISNALEDSSCGKIEVFEFNKSEGYFHPQRHMYAIILAESEKKAWDLLLKRVAEEAETEGSNSTDTGKTTDEIATQWKLRKQYPPTDEGVLFYFDVDFSLRLRRLPS